jgi:spermidine/putrescine transport system substrate-binding protein
VLIAAKPRIRTFAPDTGQDLLIAGEVDLCREYNGDILQVMEEDDELSYVVPSEGTARWEDTMCIAKGAPNPAGAHAFINYIYEPEVHAAIAEYVRYALPNSAAKALIPEADRLNEAIYPPLEVMQRSEIDRYKGNEVEALFQAAMTRVLAA